MSPTRQDRRNLKSLAHKYGLRSPTVGADVADEQMRLGHRYRNRLVEIERDRRDRYHEALAGCDDTVAEAAALVGELRADLEALREDIQQQRTGTRRKAQDPEGKEATAVLRRDLSAAYKALRGAEAEARKTKEGRAAVREVDSRAREEARAVYQGYGGAGLYWGTRCAWDRVAKDQFRVDTPPRFRRWDGSGSLAVQLQSSGDRNGYGIDDIMGEGPDADAARRLVRLDLEDEVRRQGRRYGTLSVRVGSDGRDPVWSTWPIIWHRPIPDGARVKWVKVVARRVATKRKWTVSFEFQMPQSWVREPCGEGAVAVDIGWKLLSPVSDGGEVSLRVARWLGHDGESGSVAVPPASVAQIAEAAHLRSRRDDHFAAAREALKPLLEAASLGEEHERRTATLQQWRSQSRLRGLVNWWTENRCPGDDAVLALMETWRQRDKHLWEWEANARRKAGARREHLFRNVAAELARRYGTLVLEGIPLDWVAQRPAPESEHYEDRSDRAHSQRQAAAPGELIDALRNAFDMRGGEVVEVGAQPSPEAMLVKYGERSGDGELAGTARELEAGGER